MDKVKLEKQYNENKNAVVGGDLKCPVCGMTFKKVQYSQAFCCIKCKNDYWNLKRGKSVVDVKYTSNVISMEV